MRSILFEYFPRKQRRLVMLPVRNHSNPSIDTFKNAIIHVGVKLSDINKYARLLPGTIYSRCPPVVKDGIKGGLMGLSVFALLSGTYLICDLFNSNDIPATSYAILQQLTTSKEVHLIAIGFFSVGAFGNIAVGLVERNEEYVRKIF